MRVERLGAPRVVMCNPDSRHRYFGWPTATRLQDGRLAVVASGYRLQHVCPFGKTVISYSEDEGAHYSIPAPVIDTPLDDRDGGILAFGERGIMVTSFNNHPDEQRRWAAGTAEEGYRIAYLDTLTEEDVRRYLGATFRISHDGGRVFGPIYRSPISSPHGPLALPDGRVLWVGRTFSPIDRKTEGDRVRAFLVNTEDGSMTHLGDVPNIVSEEGEALLSCEPHAILLSDGRILCHIRVQDARYTVFTLYETLSSDGGRTWSVPRPLLPRNGGAPAHLFRHSSGILISAYGYRQKPYGIRAMLSRDEGATWEVDRILYEDENSADLGYPSTVELADSSLLTVFYAHPEKDGTAVILQQRWRLVP